MHYKILETYKPDSTYLVEDDLGEKRVLRKNAPGVAVAFYDYLERQKHPLLNYIPKHYPDKGDNSCYLREYFEGETAGNSIYQFGFSDEAFKVLSPRELVQVIKLVQGIPFEGADKTVVDPVRCSLSNGAQTSGAQKRGLKPSVRANAATFLWPLEFRDANWYLERLNEPREALDNLVGKGTYRKVKSKMSAVKNAVDAETRYLANGDLHPQNILLLESPLPPYTANFIILDWDLPHINNPGYDLSFLYLWGWRNENWRQRILKEYQKFNQPYEICFNFCLAYLSAQLIKHAKIVLEEFIADEEAAREKLAEDFLKKMIQELRFSIQKFS